MFLNPIILAYFNKIFNNIHICISFKEKIKDNIEEEKIGYDIEKQ